MPMSCTFDPNRGSYDSVLQRASLRNPPLPRLLNSPKTRFSSTCLHLYFDTLSSFCYLLFSSISSRDKKWHFTFALLSACHLFLFGFALGTSRWHRHAPCAHRRGDDSSSECGWWATPRLLLLGAQSLRPMMLISQLRTVRRVFMNVIR